MAKLLLVEDDNNLREIYEARLQAEGYEIVTARDGEEALTIAKDQRPELIISDVMMPKISGFEMLDILRNTDGLKNIKVIMLTALGQNDDQQRADRLGADRYLVKSQVTLEDIVKVAHELLKDEPIDTATQAAEAPAAQPVAAAAPPVPPIQPAPAPQPTAPPPAPVAQPQPAAPAPTPAPTPVANATTAQAVDATAPQTEAAESADVEAKIENFVAGATEDAGAAPEAAALPEPTLPAPQPTPPQPVPTPTAQQTTQTADDKLVTDAAQRLAENTPSAADEDKASGSPTVTTATPPPPQAPAPPDIESVAQPQPESENVTIAHKKVIAPPAATNKKDIETLLAEEEAKGNVVQNAPPQIVTGDGNSKPEDDGEIDPHSIAL